MVEHGDPGGREAEARTGGPFLPGGGGPGSGAGPVPPRRPPPGPPGKRGSTIRWSTKVQKTTWRARSPSAREGGAGSAAEVGQPQGEEGEEKEDHSLAKSFRGPRTQGAPGHLLHHTEQPGPTLSSGPAPPCHTPQPVAIAPQEIPETLRRDALGPEPGLDQPGEGPEQAPPPPPAVPPPTPRRIPSPGVLPHPRPIPPQHTAPPPPQGARSGGGSPPGRGAGTRGGPPPLPGRRPLSRVAAHQEDPRRSPGASERAGSA